MRTIPRATMLCIALTLATAGLLGLPGGAEAAGPRTTDEAAAVAAAADFAQANEAFYAAVAAVPGAGGMHLTPQEGLVVSTTTEAEDAIRELADTMLAPDAPVTIRVVEASAVDLESATDTVLNAAADYEAEALTVTAVGVSAANNALTIAVRGDREAARTLTESLIDVPFEIAGPVSGETLPPTTASWNSEILGQDVCNGRDNCTPLRSGLRIFQESGISAYACSSAFSARDASGNYGLLTAGHCRFSTSNPFTHGPHYLGPMTRHEVRNGDQTNAFVDIGFIPNGNATLTTTPRIFLNNNEQGRPIESIYRLRNVNGQLFEAPIEGDNLCSSGWKTGNTCGVVGPRINFASGERAVPCATYRSEPGDSGAGTYYGNSARGINWGKITEGSAGICGVGHGLFTPIGRAEQEIGVTVSSR